MKKIENNFVVTGFVGKDAEIRQFTNASVARFPLAVSRLENNGEESKRVSAFMNFEAWRKNENTGVVRPTDQGYDADRRGVFQARRMERPERRETQPYRDGSRQVLSARREGGDS